jgi:hypothetical protein
MALPTQNTAWPPKVLTAKVLPYLEKWSAWYSGNPDALTRAYGGGGTYLMNGPAVWQERPAQFAGGLVGTMARMIWGKPSTGTTGEIRLHVPLGGDIASMSADLLFGEPPAITFDTENAAADEAVANYEEDGMMARLREGSEIQAALGGVYFRAVWDKEVRPRPWVMAVHPDQAIPEWTFDQLKAVTFWEEVWREGNTVWRHLERHERGFILHGVYRGTPVELGEKVSISDIPENDSMVPLIEVEGQEPGVIPTGIEKLTAWYVPNMLPNRIWRNVPSVANWGRSDYSGVEDVMASLDEAWTSWMRDIRLGKSRVLMDQAATTSLGPGKGILSDLDQELFVGLNLGLNLDKAPIEQVQFAIRVEEHERTCAALMEQAVSGAGYSMITFNGATEGTAVTATEIANKAKRTLMTQDKKRGYWTTQLASMYETLFLLENQIFGGSVTVEIPRIEWPEAIQPGRLEVAQTIQILDAAKAISTETKVAMANPGWDKKQIEEEVQAIAGLERAAQMADAVARFGAASQLGEIDDTTRSNFQRRVNGGPSESAN